MNNKTSDHQTSSTKTQELQELQSLQNLTKRVISGAIEDILYQPIKLLDHGFIRVIDYMGDDAAITQAARVSYGKGTKSLQNDKMLIRYLMKHHHTSPFEMCEIKMHIKAPIFVARQWVRHRTANINEYSGRYSLMADEYYVPEREHLTVQSLDNKQGRGDVLSPGSSNKAHSLIKEAGEQAFNKYDELLAINGNQAEQGVEADNQKSDGLAREIARIVLPLSTYTEFYWKLDLHNLLHFLNLRAHPHAQYEIRVYAEAILDIVKKWVPISYQAFIDYKKEAFVLSKEANKVITDLLHGKVIDKANYVLSAREWGELKDKFGDFIK